MPLQGWDHDGRRASVDRVGRPPGTRAPAPVGVVLEVLMRALHTVRTVPARAAVRLQVLQADREAGMTTAEYAVGTVAAAGFGGILYKLLTSEVVLGLLRDMISKAFEFSF